MSGRPPARMEQPGSHWPDFYEIFIFEHFLENLSKKNSGIVKI
jgi:hypothetical protein